MSETEIIKARAKARAMYGAHEALVRLGYNDFDYITLSWLLGYNVQGGVELLKKMTEADIITCKQLAGPNSFCIFKMLEARVCEGVNRG